MDDRTFDDPEVAKEWIRAIEGDRSGVRSRDGDIYPRVRSWVENVAPHEILEVGSGQGACSDQIGLDGRNYTGLEPSSALVERARQLYSQGNRRFVIGNAYALPFPGGAFDAAFAVAVWHLLADLRTAATELSRVLKPGGHFLIVTANPDAYSLWTSVYEESKLEDRRFEGSMRRPDGSASRDVLYLHPAEEILGTLRSAGLHVSDAETFRKSFISIQGTKPEGVE